MTFVFAIYWDPLGKGKGGEGRGQSPPIPKDLKGKQLAQSHTQLTLYIQTKYNLSLIPSR